MYYVVTRVHRQQMGTANPGDARAFGVVRLRAFGTDFRIIDVKKFPKEVAGTTITPDEST